MSVVDDARAALERLVADRNSRIAEQDELQAALDTILSANAGLRARLDLLQQEFDAYKQEHPSTTSREDE